MKSVSIPYFFGINPYNHATHSATINQKFLIVDPVPPKGGIINLAAKLCFDENKKPIFVYQKYDENGNLQLYVAQITGDSWESKVITQWDYRWEFSGNGSIRSEFKIKNFNRRTDGLFEVGYWHIKYGNGTILLNKALQPAGKVLKPAPLLTSYYGESKLEVEGNFPGLGIRTVGDDGKLGEEDVRYVLKWETLGSNRNKPRPKPWPPASKLYLYKLKKNN